MKKIKKGTKIVVTARTSEHEFKIGEIVMACHGFKRGEEEIDFENKNGDCWYLDPDEYGFLEDVYLKLKKERWFIGLLKIDDFETLRKHIHNNKITSYINYRKLPGEQSYDKAALLLEYKETLLKCKTPKTPKKICIEDIKDSDIIGFKVDSYGKGRIVFVGAPYFVAISTENYRGISNKAFGIFSINRHKSQKETASYLNKKWGNTKFYKFKTHKKLFKWLVKE